MARTPLTAIRLPQEIKAAAEAWCARHKTTFSRLVLTAVLREIGRLDLMEVAPKPGRPRAAPAKKKRQK